MTNKDWPEGADVARREWGRTEMQSDRQSAQRAELENCVCPLTDGLGQARTELLASEPKNKPATSECLYQSTCSIRGPRGGEKAEGNCILFLIDVLFWPSTVDLPDVSKLLSHNYWP